MKFTILKECNTIVEYSRTVKTITTTRANAKNLINKLRLILNNSSAGGRSFQSKDRKYQGIMKPSGMDMIFSFSRYDSNTQNPDLDYF